MGVSTEALVAGVCTNEPFLESPPPPTTLGAP